MIVRLVIWAGNNEDYMLAERWGWEYDPSDQEGPWSHTNFPAREIYERVLPAICESLAGDVPYWRSSPYGGKTSNDVTVGDTHIWDGLSFFHLTLPLDQFPEALMFGNWNSMAWPHVPLSRLQILHLPLHLRIRLRVRAQYSHVAESDHSS